MKIRIQRECYIVRSGQTLIGQIWREISDANDNSKIKFRDRRELRLGDSQRWHHSLLLTGLAAKLVRHLEPNFHRVAFANLNSVDEHLLLYPILLLGCNVSARLRPKLEGV